MKVKPAVVLMSGHHSREVVGIPMAIYPVLKIIHGGLVHDNEHDLKLLKQNKYYIIPTINVDGLV